MSAFTENLIVSPLPDGKRWVLRKQFSYDVGEEGSGETIVVPAGFITDFASIPRAFWAILPKWGKYGNAAVVHDYLYCTQPEQYCRRRADEIFLEAMLVLNVGKCTAKTMYYAVRWFGRIGWNKASELKGKRKDKFVELPEEILEIPQLLLKDFVLQKAGENVKN